MTKKKTEGLVRSFQKQFPGVKRFGDEGASAFNAAERDYKVELCRLYDAIFRDKPAPLGESAERRAFIENVEDLFTQPLKANANKPQNLVGWRYQEVIRQLDPAGKENLAALIDRLLDEHQPIEPRIDDFVRGLSHLVAGSGASLGDAASRSLTTFLLFVAHPRRHFYVKTREVNRLLKAFGEPPLDGLLSGADYRRVLDVAYAVRDELAASGWAPRDMIDVQSFVWVAMAYEAGEVAPEDQVYWVKLTSGAIDNGYIPAGQRGRFFPEQFFGGSSEADAGETFTLVLEGGEEQWRTDIRSSGSSGRIRSRFSGLYRRLGIEAGDVAVIREQGPRMYQLSFEKQRSQEPARAEREERTMGTPLNQILYGPPGTGKTYRTIDKSLAILDPDFYEANRGDRSAIKQRFDELCAEDRVRFITFHQSFSYEDFVEGLRADYDDEKGTLVYKPEPGIFRKLVEDAVLSRRGGNAFGVSRSAQVWKISIDGTGPSERRNQCFERGEARIGWGYVGDLSDEGRPEAERGAFRGESATNQNTLMAFAEGIKEGDLLLCIGSTRTVQAVGVVQGEYRFDQSEPEVWGDYSHVRRVRWLATGLDLDLVEMNGGKGFTLKTVYQLSRMSPAEIMGLIDTPPVEPSAGREPYVMIIDEINRGNISRIFGELITLIEPSKRAGREEALSAKLPYSKKDFSVPDNVYIIGTMNTADRSLAGLDIALRRRFVFEEIAPDPSALSGVAVEGVDLAAMLQAINQRIEGLLNRDYCLGHSYFLPLEREPTLSMLAAIFRRQILPLLQEYFFEDWERIRWVLNDQRKLADEFRFIVQSEHDGHALFGEGTVASDALRRWRLQDSALDHIESYQQIISAPFGGDA